MKPSITINNRKIGPEYSPFVIAEIGINHQGNFEKAIQMIDDAGQAGCECVKFQSHVIDDEMIPNNVIPGNARESIWDIMSRCAFTEEQEQKLKAYVEARGLIFLSTPFSRAAADRLHRMNLDFYKVGSGECNNYPLVKHIASFGKPVILSTGMNNLDSVAISVGILRQADVPFAIMQCTSMYPTPYDKVNLGALKLLATAFPEAVLGLSDHSLGIYTCLASVAFGASILEKHFTSDKTWSGPDTPISINPPELKELILGSRAIFYALGSEKEILAEEAPTISFAYACVVSIKEIKKGEKLGSENIWVKRPGTGEILAEHYEQLLGKTATRDIPVNIQIRWADFQ